MEGSAAGPVSLGEEGDTFSFSVGNPTTATISTSPVAAGSGPGAAARRRGGGAPARGNAVAGKTRGGAAVAASGRGRGGASTAGAAARRVAAGAGRGASAVDGFSSGDPRRAQAVTEGEDDDEGSEDDGEEDSGEASADEDEDEGTAASAANPAEPHQAVARNGATWTSTNVEAAKESMVSDIYLELLDDVLHEVVFEMHRRAKTGLMCFDCEDRYPNTIVDKNGYDVFGQAVSGKIVTGEVRFDCLNCGRTVVASRYAPHLEKCMGIGRVARNSSRIASRRMKSNYDDDIYAQGQPMYVISPSLDEDNEDDEDDDGTYGEHGKRALKEDGDAYGAGEGHGGASNGSAGHSASGRAATAKTGKRAATTVGGANAKKGAAARKPPKKKGRVSAEAAIQADGSPLGSFGGDDDQPISFGDDIDIEVVEEMDAGAIPFGGSRHHVDEDALIEIGYDDGEPEEKTTAKRKTKPAIGKGKGK